MRPGCQAHSSLPLGEGDRMQRPLQQGDIRGTRSALRPVLEATAHSSRSCRPRPPGAPGGPLALHTAPFPALVRGPAGHMASLLEAGGLERCLQERHMTCSRNWLSADCSASYTLPSVVTFGSTESPGSASGSWSCLTSPTPAKVLTWWPVAPGPAPSIHYPRQLRHTLARPRREEVEAGTGEGRTYQAERLGEDPNSCPGHA